MVCCSSLMLLMNPEKLRFLSSKASSFFAFSRFNISMSSCSCRIELGNHIHLSISLSRGNSHTYSWYVALSSNCIISRATTSYSSLLLRIRCASLSSSLRDAICSAVDPTCLAIVASQKVSHPIHHHKAVSFFTCLITNDTITLHIFGVGLLQKWMTFYRCLITCKKQQHGLVRVLAISLYVLRYWMDTTASYYYSRCFDRFIGQVGHPCAGLLL